MEKEIKDPLVALWNDGRPCEVVIKSINGEVLSVLSQVQVTREEKYDQDGGGDLATKLADTLTIKGDICLENPVALSRQTKN